MKTPLVGRRYKIVGELDSGHEGNKIGDIITCTGYDDNDPTYVEFNSIDLYWDGDLHRSEQTDPSWHYGLVPKNIDLHWYDVLELIEE